MPFPSQQVLETALTPGTLSWNHEPSNFQPFWVSLGFTLKHQSKTIPKPVCILKEGLLVKGIERGELQSQLLGIQKALRHEPPAEAPEADETKTGPFFSAFLAYTPLDKNRSK